MKISASRLSSVLVIAAVCSSGCSGNRNTNLPNPRVIPAEGAPTPDISEMYRSIGLIAVSNPISFVGKIAAFAGPTPDTTLLLASISIPNHALTFAREGDKYRAPYEVKLVVNRGDVQQAAVDVMEIVRVGSFREVNRTDESVIFQHYFRVPPGTYTLSTSVRDVGGQRTANQQATVDVPRLGAGTLSTPTVVYEAAGRSSLDSAPQLLASPRSSAVFGRDSTVAIYVEAYGQGARLPLDYIVRTDKGANLWRDSTTLVRHGALFSGTVHVPISTVGVGVANVLFRRRDVVDTSEAPLFVSFGEDIPLMSFEDMIGYLRFFASPSRLNALRNAAPERRASVWADFLRATDPVPETPINEEMQSYFGRIQQANAQFRMDRNPGWLSDRGMVFVALGEPDQVIEQNVNATLSATQMGSTARLQIWQYRQYNSQLVFYEDAGGWRLTRPSESEFLSLSARHQR